MYTSGDLGFHDADAVGQEEDNDEEEDDGINESVALVDNAALDDIRLQSMGVGVSIPDAAIMSNSPRSIGVGV